MAIKFYKLVGREVVQADDVLECIEWSATNDVHVDDTETCDFRVSTVFLRTDLSYGRGAPTFFETMVFMSDSFLTRYPDSEPFDRRQFRYSTWEQAAEGHVAVVEAVEAHVAEQVAKTIEASPRR